MCHRSPISPCTCQPLDHLGLLRQSNRLQADAVVGAPKEELDTDKTTEILGARLYVNWTPGGDIRASAVAVGKFLGGRRVWQQVLPALVW